ncbi:Hermansky-Pudlak syndrome 4 protein homolog isoform X2 [Thrips palmi]|uniref:Hermansky-Pudlak syndrome 4 protein homolog isoform X2 n=1 Tax=Thrips palmi TaxID=161013 RepID=A0A6P8Y9U6_THRPL|nr:Hermansky-Pudlak syndrome 4 protein homolog isoform X2 [Thrips palmi]
MANRELVIAFVYDTQKCTQEADDPQDAVLFFHPGWVSEQQRLALCGQLMGATYFLLASFSPPRILSLQSGKFAIRTFGRYVVAIGTDRNIPEWVLEQRADIMTSLLELYFGDLETLATQCETKKAAGDTGPSFTEKLGRIFETFLPIVQYSSQILGNVPTMRLPKSASHVFLEAMQMLHCCQDQHGVLGGAVLYQNKIIASQLSAKITKQLVLSDPYRIKSPGTNLDVSFQLPAGAQLLQVFIPQREFHSLARDAEHIQNTFAQVDKAPKVVSRSSKEFIPCLKSDKTKIFTVVEEEDGETESDVVFSHTLPPSTLSNSKVLSPTIEENFEPSSDATSRLVCSTPLRDFNINKVLHAQAVSICSRVDATEVPVNKVPVADVADNDLICNPVNTIPDVVRDAVAARSNKRSAIEKIHVAIPPSNIFQAVYDLRTYLKEQTHGKSLSMSLPSINTNNVPMRYYSFGLPVPTDEQCSPQRPRRCFYNTITDPCFPVFRQDGLPLSQALFDEQIANHYRALDSKPAFKVKPLQSKPAVTARLPPRASIPLQPVKSVSEKEVPPTNIQVEPSSQPKKRPVSLALKTISSPEGAPSDVKMEVSKESFKPPAQPVRPTSLNAPLSNRPTTLSGLNDTKEVSSNSNENKAQLEERKRIAQQALPSVARPTSLSGGLAITPLMAKLSHLALDRYGVMTPATDPTPSEPKDMTFSNRVETPMVPFPKPLPRLSQSDLEEFAGDGNREAVLLVCGMQSMSLLLLLDPKSVSSDLLKTVWDVSFPSMEHLEQTMNHSLDHVPAAGNSGADSYSFLCIDPAWDTVHKGGVWSGPELELVGSLHRDFQDQPNLTEICVRVHESLVYGYQCGQAEVFYQQQQAGQSGVGLPTPADLMGTVPLKARRRLERDHGIVLL